MIIIINNMYNIIDGRDRCAPIVIGSVANYYPKHDDGRNPMARARSGLAWWSCSEQPPARVRVRHVKLHFTLTGNAERDDYTRVPLVSSRKRRRRRRRTPTEHND